MLCAEVALQALGIVHFGVIDVTDVRLVRLDDYLAYGFEILVAMMEQSKKVYPAEKADDMLGFLKPTAELEELSRFEVNVWEYNGWCDWPLSNGFCRDDIKEMLMECV